MLIELSKNQVSITSNPKIYPLDAIYGAAYVFLNRAFIFLDENKKGEILITLKARQKMNQKQLDDLGGEFHNELLNYSLRNEIAKNNQKLREYVVSRALIGALGKDGGEDTEGDEEECQECLEEETPEVEYLEEEIEEWKGDDLGISVPWEEQSKKTKKKKTP